MIPGQGAWAETQHQSCALVDDRDQRCRHIEREEPQDDAHHQMIEERLRKQIDHQIRIRIEQPQVIAEEHLMERGPEAIEVRQDPDPQQTQKQDEQHRDLKQAGAEHIEEMSAALPYAQCQREDDHAQGDPSDHHRILIQGAHIDHMRLFTRVERLLFRPVDAHLHIDRIHLAAQIVQQRRRRFHQVFLRHPQRFGGVQFPILFFKKSHIEAVHVHAAQQQEHDQ